MRLAILPYGELYSFVKRSQQAIIQDLGDNRARLFVWAYLYFDDDSPVLIRVEAPEDDYFCVKTKTYNLDRLLIKVEAALSCRREKDSYIITKEEVNDGFR